MPLSESQKRGNEKYQKSKCIRISLILNKKLGENLINHINKTGDTKNGFIIKAIIEKLERDSKKSFNELLQDFKIKDT